MTVLSLRGTQDDGAVRCATLRMTVLSLRDAQDDGAFAARRSG